MLEKIRGLCKDKLCSRKKRQSSTPLPKLKVATVGAMVIVNQIGGAFIFPFLPFMVHDFFPQLSKEELGQKAGFLGSAYFSGNLFGSLLWGWVSDHWGRRPVMLMGVIGILVFELLFGFSLNFAWAVCARFLWGFINANIGIAKCYLSEICDDTNQAQAFAVFGTAGGAGRLLGSIIGGYLAQPASKYTALQYDFFCQFPYVLPVFVVVLIGMISFTGGFCFVEETLYKTRKDKYEVQSRNLDDSSNDPSDTDVDTDVDPDVEMVSLTVNNTEMDTNHHDMESDIDSQSMEDSSDVEALQVAINSDSEQLLLNTDVGKESMSSKIRRKIEYYNIVAVWGRFISFQKEQCIACIQCCKPKGTSSIKDHSIGQLFLKILLKLRDTLKLLLDRRILTSILLYVCLGFLAIILNELFPLLMINNQVHGGYQLDDNEIATFVTIVAVFVMIYQPLIYPRIARILGYRHFLRISFIVFACGCILTPWSNSITGPIDDDVGGMYNSSGSGLGSGISDVVNGTGDFCGRSYNETSVNENSIVRIPFKVWAIVLVSLSLVIFGRISGFTCLMVMINNSAVIKVRGSVNGISQSLVALSRALGPTVGSLLFAWSENNGLPWPLNYHLVFMLCCIASIGLVLFSFVLPKSIEKKREE